MMTKTVRAQMSEYSKDDFNRLFDWFFILNLARMDFHEFLHIYIRRESGLKNTYFVGDAEENMCEAMDDILFWEIFGPEYGFHEYDPLSNILEDKIGDGIILERD